jgi:hypothetical protein
MPKHLIADAKAMLEAELPTLNDYQANEFRKAIEEKEVEAKAHADAFVQQRVAALLADRTEALKQLTEARDAYDELASEAKEGRISTADASSRLNQLTQRQLQSEERLARIAKQAEILAAVEEDPVAWADEQARRVPSTMPEWGF